MRIVKPKETEKEASFNWPHKGYGRIFVSTPEDVKMAQEIIKQVDLEVNTFPCEYDYLPHDLIAINPDNGEAWEDTSLIYYGKFEFEDLYEPFVEKMKESNIKFEIEVANWDNIYQEWTTSLEQKHGYDAKFYW